MSSSGVYNMVYPWQRETIFWACIVEVGVIDAHPSFAFLFRDHYHICQPVWIFHLSNESGFQQFVNLIPDNLLPAWLETSDPLSDGSCCWKDVKSMRDDGGVNSLYIRVRPCKDIMVLPEGVLDVPGFFRRQEGTDMCEVSTFFRNLDHLQGIRCRWIFVRRTQ